LFNKVALRGDEGKVAIVGLSVVVGILESWTLKRREEPGPNEGAWVLHGILSYQNDSLLLDEALEKEVTLRFSSSQQYRLTGGHLTITNRNLLIEEGTLWPL
jgi:hypothetical protein